MRILVLDDDPTNERIPVFLRRLSEGNEVVVARTAQQAIDALGGAGRFDIATLDHDLGDVVSQGIYGGVVETTGKDVCCFIRLMPEERRPRKVYVHSWNPPGALWMTSYLKQLGMDVLYIPFNDDPDTAWPRNPNT